MYIVALTVLSLIVLCLITVIVVNFTKSSIEKDENIVIDVTHKKGYGEPYNQIGVEKIPCDIDIEYWADYLNELRIEVFYSSGVDPIRRMDNTDLEMTAEALYKDLLTHRCMAFTNEYISLLGHKEISGVMFEYKQTFRFLVFLHKEYLPKDIKEINVSMWKKSRFSLENVIAHVINSVNQGRPYPHYDSEEYGTIEIKEYRQEI